MMYYPSFPVSQVRGRTFVAVPAGSLTELDKWGRSFFVTKLTKKDRPHCHSGWRDCVDKNFSDMPINDKKDTVA